MPAKPKLSHLYICGVAVDYEIGHTDIKAWSSLGAMKKELGPKHMKQCGYAKIDVRVVKRVHGTVG